MTSEVSKDLLHTSLKRIQDLASPELAKVVEEASSVGRTLG